MLVVGSQVKAARALADIDQGRLAKLAGLNVSTIVAIEKRRGQIITSGLGMVKAITYALRPFGIDFLNSGDVFGVSMKSSGTA